MYFVDFELSVKLDHTSFIDGYIESTRVLIEQKGRDIDLRKGYKQSDGSMLTPYQQDRRYSGYLPRDQNPCWIIVCKIQEYHQLICVFLYANSNPAISDLFGYCGGNLTCEVDRQITHPGHLAIQSQYRLYSHLTISYLLIW